MSADSLSHQEIKHAQLTWAHLSIAKRASRLRDLKKTLLDNGDEYSLALQRCNSGSLFDNRSIEFLPSLYSLDAYSFHAHRLFRKQSRLVHSSLIFFYQRTLNDFSPAGVICLRWTAQSSFSLLIHQLSQALIVGNAAVIYFDTKWAELIVLLRETIEETRVLNHLVTFVPATQTLAEEIITENFQFISYLGNQDEEAIKFNEKALKNHIAYKIHPNKTGPLVLFPGANCELSAEGLSWLLQQSFYRPINSIWVHKSIFKNFSALLEKKLASISDLKLKPVALGEQRSLKENEIPLFMYDSPVTLKDHPQVKNYLSGFLTIHAANTSLARETAIHLNTDYLFLNETPYQEKFTIEFPHYYVRRRVLNTPRFNFYFKRPWWPPHDQFQKQALDRVLDFVGGNFVEKLKSFALVVWNLAHLFKIKK